MKRYEILAPEIGSIVYSVGFSRVGEKYYNFRIRTLTVTNWSYNYRYGLTVEGYVKGEYGSYQVDGKYIFPSMEDAETAINKIKKLNN